MTIKELKKKYKNEWILAEVLEEDEAYQPTKVKIITHSQDREEVYDALLKIKSGSHVATFYTGEIPKKGYAVPLIILGKSELKNIKAVVHDLPAASYVDGLLGLNFLKNFKLVLDFQNGILELKTKGGEKSLFRFKL